MFYFTYFKTHPASYTNAHQHGSRGVAIVYADDDDDDDESTETHNKLNVRVRLVCSLCVVLDLWMDYRGAQINS